MPEIIAPAPPGVQSTFDKTLGPQPAKTKVGDKFREEFAKLTKPQGQELPPEKHTPEAPAPVKPATESATPDATKTEEVVEPKTTTDDKKPDSPLDAVLAKTPKEEKPAEEADDVKEFSKITDPSDIVKNWGKAREGLSRRDATINELQSKLKSLETAPKAEPSVVEALQKERDELAAKYQQQEEKLKAINYQYSDEYQGLLKDRDNTLTKISSRVKAYGGDANALIEALSLPEGKIKTAQIKEALAEVDSDDKPRIHALIETYETANEKIEDATKNSAPKWDELRSRRDLELAEQSQVAIKQLETQYGKVVEDILKNTTTLLDAGPDFKDWNDEISAAVETGLKVLKPNGADFNQSVEIAVKGARYDSLEKRFLSLHADYSDLKKKYNEAVGSSPDFKGGTKTAPATPKKPAMKYHEALAAIKSGAALGEM